MATREENLKKINDDLEQLSDEELENVAGGLRDFGLWDKKLWDKVDSGQVPSINEPKEGAIPDNRLFKK